MDTLDRMGTDLAVSLTNAASTLHAGRSMTYCLTATDNGPFTATGVSVVLTLPSGVTVTNAGGGTVSANTLTWSVAKLLTGKHVNFKVTVQDTATSGTTLTATASVAGSPAPDPNSPTTPLPRRRLLPDAREPASERQCATGPGFHSRVGSHWRIEVQV